MKVLVCLLLICLLASPSIAFAVPKLSNFHRFTNNAINNKHHNSIQQNIKRSRLFMMRRGISNNSNRQFNNDNSLVQQLTRKTVTNALIFTNIAIFILQKIYPSLTNALMKVNPLVARGQTYRLVTACFAHGSITHLGFNMYSLYNIGPLAEAKFGSTRFATMFLLAGLLGNLFTYTGGYSPYSLGASGCICGLLGAICTFYYRNKQVLGQEADYALSSLQRNVMMMALYSMPQISGSVDSMGHVGGFLGGTLLSYLVGPRLRWSKKKNMYGMSKLLDKPVLNYVSPWKKFVKWMEGNSDQKADE